MRVVAGRRGRICGQEGAVQAPSFARAHWMGVCEPPTRWTSTRASSGGHGRSVPLTTLPPASVLLTSDATRGGEERQTARSERPAPASVSRDPSALWPPPISICL